MSRFLLALASGVLILSPAYADAPRNIRETIEYLQGLQTPSGGFRMQQAKKGEKPPEPTLRSTTAGVRALKHFGGKVPNVQAAQQFVARCFDPKTGGFANTPGGRPDVFSTAVGAMAVVELGMPAAKYRKSVVHYLEKNAQSFEDIRIAAAALESLHAKTIRAETWIKQIRKLQNPDGTFGEGDATARMTGSAVAAILRLGGKITHRDRILAALKEGQQLNGAYGKGETPTDAELATTYRVMRTFHMLKALPGEPEGVRSYVEKCRNEDGGYSLAPARRSNIAATYYASMIKNWLKEK